jgi:hypothetical protein
LPERKTTPLPLVEGLRISSDLNYWDTVSLANLLRFGLYETVLGSWTGDVKVISSMGKQSSRKSHLLTHLSGSLPDVAGGRCTNGVWMAVHFTSDCLYMLLDFEGLGSFECSQDMLLLILNAAFSDITSFNKKASDLTIKLYIIHHLCTVRKILPPPLMRLCASCVSLVPTTEDHSCSKLGELNTAAVLTMC